MTKKRLWIIFNRETGLIVERFGRHGSKAAAQVMLEEYLDAFAVDVRDTFEVRQQPALDETECTPVI